MAASPPSWLRTLVNAHPALYWPWRHSLRLALLTTVPLAVGFYTGHLTQALFVCLGGLLSAITVQTDPYSERFPRIFAAVPFGMLGFFWGALIAGNHLATIAGVVLAALVSGWISFWGKAFSAGALQMLVLTVIASHLPPGSVSLWLPVLFATGAVYAATLLAIEALLIPKQPEKKLVALVFDSLAEFARTAALSDSNDSAVKAALHNTLLNQANAYDVLSDIDVRQDGLPKARRERPMGQQCLTWLDALTVLIAKHRGDAANLLPLADFLKATAHAVMHPHAANSAARLQAIALPQQAEIAAVVRSIAVLFSQPLDFERTRAKSVARRLADDWHGLCAGGLRVKLQAQRSNFVNILSLALCMLVAMLAEFNLPGNRSYWIPLTVAVILKPDFGSVFVRAVQRSLGTLLGVLIAVAIFYWVPKGMWLVAVVGCLSVILPWSSLKNYAWQCTFLTPLILILLDLIIAGPTVDYGQQRLIDTVLGALIVLVFGYFIWPKPVTTSYAQHRQSLRKAVLAYLAALQAWQPGAQASSTSGGGLLAATQTERHQAYAEIFSLRKWLQNFLGEPPAISQQAFEKLPCMDEAEALVDAIDSYAVQCQNSGQAVAEDQMAQWTEQAKVLG